MKHNLLKSVILSVILLVGVSKVWAWEDAWNGGSFSVCMPGWTAGFDTSKDQEVTFSINGQSTTLKSPEGEAGVDRDLTQSKIISSLKITGYKVYMYHKNKDGGQEGNGANIHSSELSWNIYNPQGTIIGNGTCIGAYINEDNWDNNQQNQRWGTSNQDYSLLSKVVAKTTEDIKYTIDFWFKATSKWTSGQNNTEWSKLCTIWYPGNSQNFKYQFTIPKTTLTLNSSTGSPTLSSTINQEIALNTDYTLTASEITGYDFESWTTTSGNITITNSASRTDAKVKFTSFTSATVTANYKGKTYTVTLNPQSGTGGTPSVTATYGSAMPKITKPTRTGYTFNGYYDATTGGTQYYKADGSSARTWNKTAASTLYARWTINSHNVTWKANGGNWGGSTADKVVSYNYGATITKVADPTRTGYTFNAWSPAFAANTTMPDNALTYTAQWSANTYTVTFDQQSGTGGTASVTATYNAAMPAITKPTRDGYIFGGYYAEPNGQGKIYYNADGSSANNWDKENATLYAKWVEYAKCIFFKNNVGWGNVYIYTFTDNAWFNEDNGDNKRGVNPQVNKLEHGKMTKLNNESDIYYYILTQEDGFNHVAFSEKDMRTYTTFYQSKASYRSDRSDQMPLFIPKNEVNDPNVNATDYYNNGVWMKYNSKESGYRLNLMGEGGVYFITNEPGGYVFTATVHLSTKNPYKLDITTLQSEKKFSNENYMTSANCTGWTMDEWNWATESTWGINPTLVGEYTFTMNLAEGKVSVSATYPTLQEETGDYRLLYVEQVVEKSNASGNEWKTVVTRKKAHPSDIIKPSELAGEGKIVSLHIYKDRTYQAVKKYNGSTPEFYESSSNPEVILQRCTGFNQEGESQWEDVERHMVYGPLETLPGMAMAPGRRNTAAETPVLVYDDGIKAIKTADNNGNGVWNFTVKASGSTATIDLTKTERYPLTTGNYYIRTANAEGAWHNYKIDANRMTYSEYATNNNEFTHYFCKWINTDVDGSKNVQFVIANDYGQAISDTIVADRATLYGVPLQAGEEIVGGDGLLPAKANVRFSWKEDNNALHRAYLNGSGEAAPDYLVVRDASNGNGHRLYTFDNNGNSELTEKTFSDNGGWMYHADVRAETLAPVTITATYNGKKQYFKGSDSETQPIIKGNANDTRKHPIRILYDFKENRYFTAYVPIEAVTEDVAIETDVMIIRRNHEQANQLQLTPSPRVINEGKTAYGAITFTEDFLSSDSWNVTNDKKFYWISFPFDVKLSEAFGFGKYAVHWYIEYYDGKSRAENGLFYESGTYWKYVTKSMAADYVLEANKGYLLWLNVPRVQSDNFFAGDITEISIYFPSKESIDPSYESYSNVECTLEPLWRPEGSRRYYDDSNWHLIGVPSYANTTETTQQDNAKFVYDYIAATDTYEPKSSAQIGNFKSMFAYMVQYTGNINWSTIINDYNPAQKAIIAQQKSSDNNEHLLRLELQQNGSKSDQTFIQLQEQDVTTKFDMNHDLCKIINAGANIYTIITEEQEPIQVAANLLPDSESIIPVGIKLDAAGEYTFAMPDGTDGIVVELIDYETNTTTNLLLDNYTVNLGKGTFENRFALHVQPSKVTTSVGEINTNTTGVKKYLIDGVLYMQKDGVLYDAQGRCVQ